MLAEMFCKDAETEPNCKPIGTPDYRRLAAEIASTLTLARSEFTSDANLDVVELGNEAARVHARSEPKPILPPKGLPKSQACSAPHSAHALLASLTTGGHPQRVSR